MSGEWAEKLAIQEAVLRYARAVDRGDWDGVRDAYHPDAHDDHGEFKGDLDALIAWLEERFAGVDNGMHFVGNCLVEMTAANAALVETYFISHRVQGAGNSAVCRQGWGRYIDRFEKRDDGVWRVAQRTVVMDSIIELPVSGARTSGGATVWSERGPADFLFQSRMAAGDKGNA